MMNIIFLDLDGVLTNYSTDYQYADPACMSCLNYIVEHTGAWVVITSARRFTANLSEKLKDWGATWYILDITPMLSKTTDSGLIIPFSKAMEIQAWLSAHQYVEKYVIIDDQKEGLEGLEEKTILVNGTFGLQQKSIEPIIRMLGYHIS